MKTNARLLKQSSDKDDMNAKSLSTILHLKQRNEELDKESAVIKQKSQAAQQLSLAARLASNAKNRVGEEALKEKEVSSYLIVLDFEFLSFNVLTPLSPLFHPNPYNSLLGT